MGVGKKCPAYRLRYSLTKFLIELAEVVMENLSVSIAVVFDIDILRSIRIVIHFLWTSAQKGVHLYPLHDIQAKHLI